MHNDEVIKDIMNMTIYELLDFIMRDPTYLTDTYYIKFRVAIYHRYSQLKKEEKTND